MTKLITVASCLTIAFCFVHFRGTRQLGPHQASFNDLVNAELERTSTLQHKDFSQPPFFEARRLLESNSVPDLESMEDKVFNSRAKWRGNVKHARMRISEELATLICRESPLSEAEACRKAVLEKVVRIRDQRLADSRASRDAFARELKEENLDAFLNVDESCAINAVIEAVARISPKYWLGDDKASEELQALIHQPGKVKNASAFRAAVGPEYEEVENGKIGWFPPRIFMKSILMKMDKLRNSATSIVRVDGESREETMPTLVLPLDITDLNSALSQLTFETLPTILILNLVRQDDDLMPLDYPDKFTMCASSGACNTYQFRAAVNSYYGFHTSASLTCETTDTTPNLLVYEII